MTPRTKMLILNSPNNPTGAVIDGEDLRAIVEVCRRRGVWILSDEIYEPMVYAPARHASPAALAPDRTIHVHGASKAYAMTGWRVGWACGPRDVIRAMDDVASHSTSNVTSFAQKGAAEALRACDGFVETMRATFRRRRDLIVRLLNEIPGVRCGEPQGAFYAFPNVEAAVRAKASASSAEMAERLLDDSHVAVVPGEAFGAPGCLRLSYATSDAEIDEGCRRIRSWVGR
jgi:aspartate/methionine/tyrosine aminotransferase